MCVALSMPGHEHGFVTSALIIPQAEDEFNQFLDEHDNVYRRLMAAKIDAAANRKSADIKALQGEVQKNKSVTALLFPFLMSVAEGRK
jgi:hypothetical protein